MPSLRSLRIRTSARSQGALRAQRSWSCLAFPSTSARIVCLPTHLLSEPRCVRFLMTARTRKREDDVQPKRKRAKLQEESVNEPAHGAATLSKPPKRKKLSEAKASAFATTDNPLIVENVEDWRAWLDENEDTSTGVWLTLAKKGTSQPTSLTLTQALEEALCSGWINGPGRKGDEATSMMWWTQRAKTSIWSKRNVAIVAELEQQGRMRDRGRQEVEKAKADGRWARAYDGPANAQVPDDLQAALAASPRAQEAFEALDAQKRYRILLQLMTASSDGLRAKRLQREVEKLTGEDDG